MKGLGEHHDVVDVGLVLISGQDDHGVPTSGDQPDPLMPACPLRQLSDGWGLVERDHRLVVVRGRGHACKGSETRKLKHAPLAVRRDAPGDQVRGADWSGCVLALVVDGPRVRN